MNKYISVISRSLFTLLVLSFFILPINQVYSQDSQNPLSEKITDIKIDNNETVSSATILSKLKTRVGDRFTQKAVNEDIKRLYATGFFTDVTAEIEKYKDGLRLIFSVTEKSVIGAIVFEGNSLYKEEALKKQIETETGDVLNRRRLSEDVKKLKDFYNKKGFPLVDVSYNTELNKEANNTTVYITVDEKERYRIRSIEFVGNNAFNDKRLKKVIATRVKTLFRSGILDEDVLDQDMERIKAFYSDEGFIDATAIYEIEYKEKGIYVVITIDEGEQFFVGSIELKGNQVFDGSAIFKELKMHTGDPYSPNNLRYDVMATQTLYFDRGYMSCRVKPLTQLDKNKQSIDIIYQITEGELSYVNEVNITGNSKTKDVVIRRELRLYPGDKFDGKKLKKSKQRLYDLGYFDEVIFDTVATSEADQKDLLVRVKEAKTGEFSFGGGYSSVDRLIGFVEVTQRNFDIGNFETFTGAGQILNIKAEIGSVRQNYTISFTEPWIFGYPYLFGFDVFNFERDRKESLGYGYAESRIGGDLRFGKEFSDYDRADLMYKLERITIDDIASDASSALRNEEGENTISSLALTLTRNTTDSRFNPMEGHILSITGKNAGGPIGGDKDFYKLSGVADYFFNYDKKLVLELKARGGWADEYDDSDDVPIYDRFFAGGANTVRGYKERSIGPRDPSTGDPIGGELMLVGNAELTYPILKNFKVAAFCDIGNVWENVDDTEIESDDFKTGVGAGIRVKTPIGPVKIDMGYPLDKAHPDDDQKVRFHFSMTRGF